MQAALPRLDAKRGSHDLAAGGARGRHGAAGRARALALAEGVAALERVGRDHRLLVLGQHGGQRRERQPVAHRRVAFEEEDVPAAKRPGGAGPLRGGGGLRARLHLERDDVAGGRADAAGELRRELGPRGAVGQVLGQRVEAGGQVRLVPQDRPRILVGGPHEFGGKAQGGGELGGEAARILVRGRGLAGEAGQQRLALPQGRAVAPPEAGERPARQGLAGIPLALAEVQHAAGREAPPQPVQEVRGELQLAGGVGREVPLGALHVVHRDEGGLAAHREADVAVGELAVDGAPQRLDGAPLRLVEGAGDARILVDARHLHLELQRRLAHVREAGHGRGARRKRRAGEGDVALAREQPRGRVEPDPARAGDVGLAPRVQVGEVLVRAGGPVEGLLVGDELDEVARGEARGEPEAAQDLHQEPRRVAARALGPLQRLLRRLDAVLQADQVLHVVLQVVVHRDQEVDRGDGRAQVARARPARSRPRGAA